MSPSLAKSFGLSSPLKVEEEIEKQGIVSILGSDPERPLFGSLRRTLSADMSSKKWLAQNGLLPMKKIASSEQFPILSEDSSSSSEEEEEEFEAKKELKKPCQSDIWNSIVSQKCDDSAKVSPPYVHPLMKRSSSSLSEKSLEICTESLGSETGSDGFSSYLSLETRDVEDEKEVQHQSLENEDFQVVKYNYSGAKKLAPRSFPPPLPSIASGDGATIHVQSRRENGRLVLEAVSVPPRNYFNAHREGGRLLLTFVNSVCPLDEPSHEYLVDGQEGREEYEEVFENEIEAEAKEKEVEEEEEAETKSESESESEEEEIVEKESGGKEIGAKLSIGVINVHRSALMMKRFMSMDNRNPTWTKFKEGVNLVDKEVEEDVEAAAPLPHSLPPLHQVTRRISNPSTAATAASFNPYEYFWRTKPAVTTMMSTTTQKGLPLKERCNKVIFSNAGPKAYEKQEIVLLRGNKKDYLGKGCNEPRRSLLIWEPYCIATS